MKRDMDLIRTLLQQVQAQPPGQMLFVPKVEGYDRTTVLEHIQLLEEAKFIEVTIHRDGEGRPTTAVIRRLTWGGQDFLAAASNDTVWEKAKAKLKEVGLCPSQCFRLC